MIQLTDGSLISASGDHTLRHWSADDGKQLARFSGHSDWVRHVIQLANGSLVSASNDGTLRCWDLQTGRCTAYWQALPDGYSAVVDQAGIHLHSDTPIHTTEWQGQRVPNDPTLARYAGFLVDGQRLAAWRFPQALRWAEPNAAGEYHSLTLLWPDDHDPNRTLGQIITP